MCRDAQGLSAIADVAKPVQTANIEISKKSQEARGHGDQHDVVSFDFGVA